MSVEMWPDPNNPKIEYPIGTEGRELFPIAEGQGIFDTFLNAARSIYKHVTGLKDITIPTYGLWSGPGWSSGIALN